MANEGKCPKCDRVVDRVEVEQVGARTQGSNWSAVSLRCPSRDTVLSVQIDPLSLNDDLVEKIEEILKNMARNLRP